VVTFDDVLPTLVRTCDQSKLVVETWVVVRDLRGRVRLALKAGRDPLSKDALDALSGSLSAALGGYFAPPILSTSGSGDERRLGQQLLDKAERWDDPEYEDPVRGTRVRPRGNWRKLERRLSKVDWLESGSPRPPWTLKDPMPPVTTFYSFKGGVGRTTALAACAWQLAAAGQRVAVIDLDLEAPGLGTLLGADSSRGVIDFVVDHIATGAADLDGLPAPARAFGPDAERVVVFPAGRLGLGYLDKLARLDFTASTGWDEGVGPASPTSGALRALIQAIGRQDPRPDFIFVDSRAGLHDLAGLSLHGLGHVDVLFSKASEQGYQGLDLAVSILARRRGPDFSCIAVHALAPTRGLPESQAEEEEFRQRAYGMFREHVYDEAHGFDGTNLPDAGSDIDLHSPVVMHFDQELQRFVSLGDRRSALFGEDFEALRKRIVELCERETDEDEG